MRRKADECGWAFLGACGADGRRLPPSAPCLQSDAQILPAGPRLHVGPNSTYLLAAVCSSSVVVPDAISSGRHAAIQMPNSSASIFHWRCWRVRREPPLATVFPTGSDSARGDATRFDAEALFGRATFDRVFISYSLSMIPGWEKAIDAALATLCAGGSLHIVDFGQQEGLPRWFRTGLRGWLAKFHVEPRDSLREVLESECQRYGASLSFETLYRGYVVHAVVRKRG